MKRAILLLCCGLFVLWAAQVVPTNQPVLATGQVPQHTEVKIDSTLFDQYVGQYVFPDDPDYIFSFWREGDKFFLQPTNQVKLEIFPESDSKFFLKVIEAQATFLRDDHGTATGLIWRQNGVDSPARKISDKPAVQVLVQFDKREEMIPTRDGVRLHTVIFTPRGHSEPLPILLNRTPYGVGESTSESINQDYNEFLGDGYIFVLQDIRGRYVSEGQFVMNRPLRDKADPKSIDESTDTYDTIAWLIKNVSGNNGRVGILGISYDGWLAAVATVDAHPALIAASPQAPMTDTYLGDDFFHNGAFRQSYGYEYVKAMESSKEVSDISFDRDAYDWYLELGSLGKLTEELNGKLPTWNAFVSHPNYDDYWRARGAENYLKSTTVATLVVGGWWDQEDYYGALATYEALEKLDKDHKNFLVIGPWNHGGWEGRGRSLGDINFGSSTGLYFRTNIQAPWFAYYLKGRGKRYEDEAFTFQTGSNKWTRFQRWPANEALAKVLYLQSGRKATFEKPTDKGDEFASYVSDPSHPVPYRKRPIQATYAPTGSAWRTWLVQDQRFLQDRDDVVTWQTDVLDKDLTIAGEVIAHLFASTTGTDSDWIVKLIDVYPDNAEDKKMAGYRLMVADEIFRGRFLKSFAKPNRLVPGEVNEYVIDLHSANHCFKPGHRVMVQVQSSWFPLYDRNPQKFVENIFKATAADYQLATQRVYESARYPSNVTLPVINP